MSYTFKASKRSDLGKGASRRLRRLEGSMPAVLYGAGQEAVSLTLEHKALWRAQEDEAFYTAILTLDIEGQEQRAIIKDLQRHPAKNQLIHADFIRVDDKVKMNVLVPLHFINEERCIGVRLQGGSITHTSNDVEVRCLPKDLPAFIEIDMTDVNAGEIIHISDLNLAEGVESVALALGADHDLALAQVVSKKGKQDDEDGAEGETEAEA